MRLERLVADNEYVDYLDSALSWEQITANTQRFFTETPQPPKKTQV